MHWLEIPITKKVFKLLSAEVAQVMVGTEGSREQLNGSVLQICGSDLDPVLHMLHKDQGDILREKSR